MRMNLVLIVAVAVLFAGSVADAQGRRGDQQNPGAQPGRGTAAQTQPAEGAQARRMPPPEEKTSVTQHTAHIGGQEIKYTATVGTYIIKDDDGNPKTTFFYVAYTKDDPSDISKRPIAFSYNGGPGSASSFVHMGFCPERVVLTPDGHGMPAPYQIVDNEDSFLDATDIVFVDAVSTGYSRPVPGENPAQFHALVEDANYFSDVIYQYITRNERWDSPKYLIGESYGTTRSAELAGVLQRRHEIYLNGIVMVSTVLIFPTIDYSPGNDMPTKFYLPTYTTTAWFHHLLAPDLQNLTLDQVAQQAREFADGEYAQALLKGDRLAAADRAKTVKDLARFTGLSPKFIEESNLRIRDTRWRKELLRDQRSIIGDLDSRFVGTDSDAAGERPEYDPSEASYEGAWVATFHDYVRRDLKWEADMAYPVR